MPDKTAERLAHYKKLLKVRGVAPGPEGLIEYLRKRDDLTKGALRPYLEGCECDQKSLDKAAKFFELDAKQEADCDIFDARVGGGAFSDAKTRPSKCRP
jgi:hypothetical protein